MVGAVASVIRQEFGAGRVESFPLPTDQDFLFRLLADIFQNHWEKIVFGTAVQGAVFEIRVADAPRNVDLADGYLTVDFGFWHFHLCIGEHKASPPEVAAWRRTARAEFSRTLAEDDTPRSWGLRLFNGGGEQQLSVFLPSPFHADNRMLPQPDWSRLELWDGLRARYLGAEPDPIDRAGRKRA
ncbi:DUF7676 family protein [Magnetospirillum sulfuroxidans]|uniref:Uncharacterized protein n=1 Tax=Magnetospirillum sulfuroxidans TaxID=611300 RepID=A0ABS5IH63_9PROT|nr:hypothetical protein [Magnetospirillum sulfuroxidans]MBR9973769.1 hypothetical protein [Magnetospirillum sulfuroxidans]